MLFELRSYRLLPGRVPDYLNRFWRDGLPALSRHLPLLGYWATETGRAEAIHHLWAYESWEERAASRLGLGGDRDWTEGFVPHGFPLIREQDSAMMALAEGSDALAAAVAGRRRLRSGPTEGAALFAAAYAALEWHADRPAPRPDSVALWQVASGRRRPGWVRLCARSASPPDPAPAADRHEVLRPLSFSPL